MDPDINMAIAKLVEGRRIHLGMSRAELARASGVSYSTLDSLERRHRGCSAADLWRIAQVLGVSMADLCSSAMEASSAPPGFETAGDLEFGARASVRAALHTDSDGYSGPH